jgi:ribosomal protein S18 acetylase RimI-like enzyme
MMIEKIVMLKETIAEQILSVQRASYQIEAALINYPDLPPLRETIADLMSAPETFLVYRDDKQIVAALSYKFKAGVLDIGRLIVSPSHFRRGIARQLLEAVERVELNVQRLMVSTAAANVPAITLYKKAGFQIFERRILPDGLALVQLEKLL